LLRCPLHVAGLLPESTKKPGFEPGYFIVKALLTGRSGS
jgi:hypothetical protein